MRASSIRSRGGIDGARLSGFDNARVDHYVVAGNPVEHSQSPFIHAAFAAALDEAMTYGRLCCPLDAFASTLRDFEAEGGRGCNVTVPFKFEAFALASRKTARAALAGACNTLRFDRDSSDSSDSSDSDGWLGDNTDGAGLVRDIEQNAGVPLADKRVLLIGAGGAAAGVLGPLVDARPREIVVVNRGAARAVALVERHRVLTRDAAPTSVAIFARPLAEAGQSFDVVINATSTSLTGNVSPVDARVLRVGSLAVDLMYGASAGPFLRWAIDQGAVARDGLGMLVEQAAESFLLFRGRRPDTAPVLAALRTRMTPTPSPARSANAD